MKSKANLDFELNLLPVISVLAVCLSFLLLTTVWVEIGTFDLSQAVGTDATDSGKNPPSMWVHFENDGTVQISVKEVEGLSSGLQFVEIKNRKQRSNVQAIAAQAQKIKAAVPNLNVALLLPAPGSSYEDMIQVMDNLKKQNIADIGISPL